MKIVEMGAENCSNEANRPHNKPPCASAPVILNVYDLTPVNNYMYWVGFGIFHSGIEVHGKEYGFGAHDFAASGVFEVEPRNCPGFIFRCSVKVGRISMPPTEFRAFIEGMASDYHGDTYHLISKNCNHFTDDISWRLTGKHIPGWVNRLARLGSLCSCLLPESLQVTTVKQLPEYHECSEDDDDGSLSSLTVREPSDDSSQDKHLLTRASSGGVTGDVAFIRASSSGLSGDIAFIRASSSGISGDVAFVRASSSGISGDVAFVRASSGGISGDVAFIRESHK